VLQLLEMTDATATVEALEAEQPGSGISAPKYAKMVQAFMELDSPTAAQIAEAAGVSRKTVYKALKEGWPKLGLPPLGDAANSLANIEKVHELMSGMEAEKKQIYENLFGQKPATSDTKAMTAAAKKEATARAAEHGMGARVALATATASAEAVSSLAVHILDQIKDGEIDFPEKIRIEHIIMLAKAADIAAGAVYKAMQTEKLRNGEPTDIVGQQVLVFLQQASPEVLQGIVKTGTLPTELLNGGGPQSKIIEGKVVPKP
jgi:hypothetical protein